MSGCDIPQQYVRLIREGRYDELGELFAVDAVFHNPLGDVLRGREEIAAFYSGFLTQLQPDVRGVRHVWDDEARVCVFELETRMSRDASGNWANDPAAPYTLSALDRMEINEDGLIQEMTVYMAPANRWLED